MKEKRKALFYCVMPTNKYGMIGIMTFCAIIGIIYASKKI